MGRLHEISCAAFFAAACTLTVSPALYGRTGACVPVRVVSQLEGPWGEALSALARATSHEGLPWSCPGGSVDLVPDASGGAELTVTDASGRSVSRKVANPDEVVPTGEALLAAPVEEPPPLPPPLPPPASTASGAPAVTPPTDPRVQIQVLIGPRVSGPAVMAWGSGMGRLQIPFGPWALGFWARYDARLGGPAGNWVHFGTSGASAGLFAGRRLLSRPFELRVTVDPSIAVTIAEAGMEDQPHPEGAKPAFRIGTTLAGLFPLAGAFRGVVALDGELAPAFVRTPGNIDTQNHPPQLPPVPTYTAGFLFGFEASIR